MKKKIGLWLEVVLVLFLATVAYHRFRVQTKSIFFSTFPIFTWVSVDQPILFNQKGEMFILLSLSRSGFAQAGFGKACLAPTGEAGSQGRQAGISGRFFQRAKLI
jgi:hypothetical protein